MIDITSDDIAALNDADLRTLIGRLCEAEMRKRGLPTSAVTYGGNQDAVDGGLDVRVSLPSGSRVDGFVPKPDTGLQVKKPDMPRGAILEEMAPGGVLRPVILDLAKVGGAYVIVSSTGSTSDTALERRREAMRDAIEGTPAKGKLRVDFYDRNRVATWVRDYPGLIPWVRAQVGRAIVGWQSYGSWSLSPSVTASGYLADDYARIRAAEHGDGEGLSAVEGINRIRMVLAVPGRVARLVGLSGVGKTRLAEALFDAKVGEAPLDPMVAIYTNEADGPIPPPAALASDLVASKTSAILVVDNCTPELHRRLSEIVRTDGSTLSLLTIEYDIREDEPEGTDVFSLEVSSVELIEKLVARRYPNLSQIDAHTVADFSGGNARVALALASRIEKTETVAGLSEEELFKRLFQQRHDPDPSLLQIAEVCSLLYSFEGETLEGDDAELPLLGSLIGKSATEVFAGVVELRRRDLVQARDKWRAVLPHAIAIRLAKRALQTVSPLMVKSVLMDKASERVVRSFSRRLGYLDGSKEALAIVKGWLEPGGLLGEITRLNEFGNSLLINVAPVAPDAVLLALELALADADEETLRRCSRYAKLLRSLAYDPVLFERCVALITRLATLSGNDGKEATEILASLFQIVLSGTHAPLGTRIKVAEGLLTSEDEAVRRLGIGVLEAMMKSGHFSSTYGFDFGARSRDYGYYPRAGDDVRLWFGAVLDLASKIARSNNPVADGARQAIAREFRGLWNNAGQLERLDRLARELGSGSFWREGWIAVRQTRIYDASKIPTEDRDRLIALEKYLRPKDLVSKVRGLVLGSRAGALDLDDFADTEGTPSDRYAIQAAKSAATINEVGHLAAADEVAFSTLLPELLAEDSGATAPFGAALAQAADDPLGMWRSMVTQFAAVPKASGRLLRGFIHGLQGRDEELADTILDEAVEDPTVAPWFPELQAGCTLNARAIERLRRALEYGRANIESYRSLAYGRASDDIPGPELRDLALHIARQTGGNAVAMEIVSMRIFGDNQQKRATPLEVQEAGRLVLEEYSFQRRAEAAHEDHSLGVVAEASLAGDKGVGAARELTRNLLTAAADYRVSGHDFGDLLKALLKVQPQAILDELFSGEQQLHSAGVRLLNDLLDHHQHVIEELADDVLISWSDEDPTVRYPIAAAIALLFKRPKDGEPHQWRPIAKRLLDSAPDPRLVLNEIVSRLRPSGWSGSLATKLEGRLKLLNTLPANAPELAEPFAAAKRRLQLQIHEERRREQDEDRSRNNRFE
jgi:hypothetical protein